ncbi:MAG: hypothetical protein Q9217_005336 [Psora testacea]
MSCRRGWSYFSVQACWFATTGGGTKDFSLILLQKTLKEIAKSLPHHIVHWFNPSSENQRIIERFDSLLNVLRLVPFASKQKLRLVCILWIALIAPALHSLICTLEDGRDYNSVYIRNGLATVPKITCYFSGSNCAPSQVAIDQLAHAYGEITLGAKSTDPDNCGSFTDVQSIIDSKGNYRYYCRRNTTVQEFGIRFNEYNIKDTRGTYPHFTNRVISASSGPCNEYPQVGNPKPATVGNQQTDGTNFISAFNHTYAINTTSNGSIIIPTSALGDEGTTYIYRSVLKPQDAGQYGYGPRGLWMWVYRNPGQNRTPRFYECPITVSPVTNVINPAHNISDGVARVAAASIALQGQFKGRKNRVFTQWQWYADKHTWNNPNGASNGDVGAKIAEHAIVSLAEMLANNPKIQTPGMVPYLGSKLKVDWQSFAALMAGIIRYGRVPKSKFGQSMKVKNEDPKRGEEDGD